MFGIKKELNIHFIGVGGIGMSGIARVLLNLGYNVSGSDLNENANIKDLRSVGAKIFRGHSDKNLTDVQLVVYSSAIDYTNPEIIKSKELKIPIIKRAEMLAELMRLKYGIAVAGSHGKTTTTSFLSTIFKNLNQKPTCIIGGIVKNLGGQAVLGDGEFLIAEADESDGSFLFLNPIMSIITNIDNDHLDYYKNEENIKKAFVEFSNKIPFYGSIAINANDKNSIDIISNIRRPHVTYGVDSKKLYVENVDYLGTELEHNEQNSQFTLIHKDKKFKVEICLSGDHNVQNALAAIAISNKVGLDLGEVCKTIKEFEGVSRRFECLYSSDNLTVIDDYGHHPTEVLATIETAKSKYKDKKLIVVFEPHRYTRTEEFWNEFIDCFRMVDKVYIAPIYAASEDEIETINSENLVAGIKEKYSNAEMIYKWDQLVDIFEENKKEKTVVLSMGAGSISVATRSKISEWQR